MKNAGKEIDKFVIQVILLCGLQYIIKITKSGIYFLFSISLYNSFNRFNGRPGRCKNDETIPISKSYVEDTGTHYCEVRRYKNKKQKKWPGRGSRESQTKSLN